MTAVQKFCTECGASLIPGARFCGKCGHSVTGVVPEGFSGTTHGGATPQYQGSAGASRDNGTEQITGIVPFVEQGLFSVIHYTLLITPQRLIFCTWNQDADEAMSDAEDEEMQESCNISETGDEIAHFRAKDWKTGPWQRYLSLSIDSIVTGAPGSITFPVATISGADIVCETKTSTQDKLYIVVADHQHEFDLMYSQGPFLYHLLQPILGEKVRLTDHLHRRGKLDRLLSGQEYK
jgi:hypothetical protein